MPRIVQPSDINALEKDIQKDYFDRHTPRVICERIARRGEKFMVKIIMGYKYPHPDEQDLFISYVQLWNRETLLADVRFTPGVLGNKPDHSEVDLYIVPKMSMNLSAMAVCTKHGLWHSESVEVKVID